MNALFAASLPELLGGLGAAIIVGLAPWATRRWRDRRTVSPAPAPLAIPGDTRVPEQVRRYTLLGTLTPDGSPAQITSTRPARTAIIYRGGGQAERFELTDALLYDGTYAAEPLDRYLWG
ncbi:hypothetical protein [Streptomyces sp. NPDC002082]|uniref:hypothetical protein n=1 Tax=Streptomyces sp. NPDC002082 TaxID=3154772 RepID=UPI003316C7D5